MNMEQKKMLEDYKELISNELFTDLGKDMKACSCDYHRHKMLSSIIRTINEIDNLIKTDDNFKNAVHSDDYTEWDESKPHELTKQEVEKWVANMKNGDGTVGEYWTMEQTTAVANQHGVDFSHIRECDWYVTMNMMHSDYGVTLESIGAGDVGVYAEMAKDFLFDKDSVQPKEKLCYYYKYIVTK